MSAPVTVARTSVLAAHDRGHAIEAAVAACLTAELSTGWSEEPGTAAPHVPVGSRELDVAGIGTTAAHALTGRLLAEALGARGLRARSSMPYEDPAALLAARQWTIALVLSPWKRAVPAVVTRTSPSAALTDVVDTVLRRGAETVGVNTNAWASQAVLELLAGTDVPHSVVILGAGASARSVALAARRAWGEVTLVVSARRDAAMLELASAFAGECAAPTELAGRIDAGDGLRFLINTTTWGETPSSEEVPFGFPVEALLRPGDVFFDLNNRTSALQSVALQAGCTVMSGTLMQRATHACRAALALATITEPEDR